MSGVLVNSYQCPQVLCKNRVVWLHLHALKEGDHAQRLTRIIQSTKVRTLCTPCKP